MTIERHWHAGLWDPARHSAIAHTDHAPQLAALQQAQARFQEAELRMLRLPKVEGDLIQVRMKQPGEWLPNGRTLLRFATNGACSIATNSKQILFANYSQ